jgi:hypothetical protein
MMICFASIAKFRDYVESILVTRELILDFSIHIIILVFAGLEF